MTTIFSSAGNDLKSFLESLSYDDILNNIYSKTFYKGEVYYENNRVSDARYSFEKDHLFAMVQGRQDYSVNIGVNNGIVSGKCSCPVGGICKHVVAVLLYAVNESNNVEISDNHDIEENNVNKYLQSLSKEALVKLVLKFAPEEFLTEIKNQYSSHAQAENILKKVSHIIGKLFGNEEILYNPLEFKENLVKQLKKLSGLEKHFNKDFGELMLSIIHKVDNATDEGYLYDDYHDGGFECPDEFDDLVKTYIQSLSFADKTAYLQRLETVLSESSYDTFGHLLSLSGDVFSENDLPSLKTMLLKGFGQLPKNLVEKYYKSVRPLLTKEEKEKILLHLKDGEKWLLELIDLYSENRKPDAIDLIKKWLSDQSNQSYISKEIYAVYLDLLKALNHDLKDVCKEAVTRCSTSAMIQKISDITQGETYEYELILEQKSPEQLLDYLENSGRLSEAHELITRKKKRIWDSRINDFYKKHKKIFKPEAENYFTEMIDKNLEFAGNSYYYTIADALKQIRQINTSLSKELIADIRLNYNRRRNLITLISEI